MCLLERTVQAGVYTKSNSAHGSKIVPRCIIPVNTRFLGINTYCVKFGDALSCIHYGNTSTPISKVA